jgi:hypothetical protein
LLDTRSGSADRRAAVRTICWPCTRERAGPRRLAFACAAAVSGDTEIGFAPETIAPHRRDLPRIFFFGRNDDRLPDFARGYEPDKLMGYCVALYFAKLLVWDKVLGFGSTDALAGFAAITANLVVSFYFAKRGFENVARIIKR